MSFIDHLAGFFRRDPLRRMRRKIERAASLAGTGKSSKAVALLRREIALAREQGAPEAVFEGCLALAEVFSKMGETGQLSRSLGEAREVAARLGGDRRRRLSKHYQKHGLALAKAGNRDLAVELFLTAGALADLTLKALEVLVRLFLSEDRRDATAVHFYTEYLKTPGREVGLSGRVSEKLREICQVPDACSGDELEAREQCNRQILDAGLDFSWTWRNLGKIYLRTARWKDALQAFSRVREIDLLEPGDLYHLAFSAHQVRDFHLCVGCLTSYLQLYPRHGAAIRLLGACQAEEFCAVYAEKPPDAGLSLLQEAIRNLEAGTGLNWGPNGEIHWDSVSEKGAPGIISEAEGGVTQEMACFFLGRTYDLLGETPRAAALLEFAARSGDPVFCRVCAEVLLKERRTEKALKVLEKGLEKNPGGAELLALYGELQIQTDLEKAETALRKAIELAPGNLEARLALVRAALSRENEILAASLLEECELLLRKSQISPTAKAKNRALIWFLNGRKALLGLKRERIAEAYNCFTHSLRSSRQAKCWRHRFWFSEHQKEVGYWQGICHAHLGDFAKARRRFKKVLSADEQNVEVIAQLALLSLAEGRHEEAEEWYQQGRAVAQDYPALCYVQSKLLEQGGKMEEAGACLASLAEDPRDPHYQALALCSLGRIREEEGDDEKAYMLYERALKLRPSLSLAHRRLGVLRARLLAGGEQGREKIDEAVWHLERALEVDKKDAEVLCFHGLMLGLRGDLETALGVFRELLKRPDVAVDPQMKAAVYDCIGTSLFQRGDYSGARKWWQKCCSLDPENETSFEKKMAQACFKEGVSLLASGPARAAEAKNLLQEALRFLPDDREYRLFTAAAEMLTKDQEEADKKFSILLSEDPNDQEALFLSGLNDLLFQEPRSESAIAKFQKLSPSEGAKDPRNMMAELFLALHAGTGEKIANLLAGLVASGDVSAIPFDWTAVGQLAVVGLAGQGKTEEAVQMLQSLLAGQPGNPLLVETWARLWGLKAVQDLQASRIEEALKDLEEALQVLEKEGSDRTSLSRPPEKAVVEEGGRKIKTAMEIAWERAITKKKGVPKQR